VAPESADRYRKLPDVTPIRVPEAFRKETSRQSFVPIVERVDVAQVAPESAERYTCPTPVGNAAILVPPDERATCSQALEPAGVDVAQVAP
jgi:hypothetical protein